MRIIPSDSIGRVGVATTLRVLTGGSMAGHGRGFERAPRKHAEISVHTHVLCWVDSNCARPPKIFKLCLRCRARSSGSIRSVCAGSRRGSRSTPPSICRRKHAAWLHQPSICRYALLNISVVQCFSNLKELGDYDSRLFKGMQYGSTVKCARVNEDGVAGGLVVAGGSAHMRQQVITDRMKEKARESKRGIHRERER